MDRRRLHELASAAGIARDWSDAQGQQRCLDDAALRRLLNTLHWPADTDALCRESLARLQQERRVLPPLLTADAGEPVLANWPAGVHRATLRDERGGSQELRLESHSHWRAPMRPGYYQLEFDERHLTLAVAPPQCYGIADACGTPVPRGWGLAAQVYALRRDDDGGAGDSRAVAELASMIATAGGDALGLSPLHALGPGCHSPYSPTDRAFLNPWHADPGQVLGEAAVRAAIEQNGLATAWRQTEAMPLIDWPAVAAMRRKVWWTLFRHMPQAAAPLQRDLADFRREGGAPLATYASIAARQVHAFEQHAPVDWHQWEPGWQAADESVARAFAETHDADVGFEIFAQWLASRCWARTRREATDAGMRLGLIADLAVGFEPGGSEAWRHRPWLLGDATLGAPPDAFNARGQHWGLASYSPDGLRRSGFQPFIEMLRATMRLGGGIRIDHVLGLSRLWTIPAGAGAEEGGYIAYPIDDLLRLLALESWRHRCVVIGEDLGTVPAGLRDRLAARGVLGTDVLLFNRDADGQFLRPCQWRASAMGTTTTHDLPPLAGWRVGRDLDWRARAGEPASAESRDARRRDVERLEQALASNEPLPSQQGPQWAALRFVARSKAPLVLFPLEDVLGLDEQPNLPGTVDEHPNWRRRMPPAELAPTLEAALPWIDRQRREPCADA
jgi:4-alpha-glucanotransferase